MCKNRWYWLHWVELLDALRVSGVVGLDWIEFRVYRLDV